MARTPIEQLVVSHKSDPRDIKGWIESREPKEVVVMDDSPTARGYAQMVHQETGSQIRNF